jgi:hypothetical protein
MQHENGPEIILYVFYTACKFCFFQALLFVVLHEEVSNIKFILVKRCCCCFCCVIQINAEL